ncbi:hypothetical protein JIN85_00370 [Luteolibacter pohnpeiensis]|uniref:Uncharacterized protein n=1 Tax=Luteolibacter pohnpeiensis TaxID=454153 RepID=A0A934S2T5_9BACT|nr:hypothetical protein [Luteolibacter pohnpeiensis]MBK1880843.1 hypothetical protein [Luteolibacter pohnpeiensis]
MKAILKIFLWILTALAGFFSLFVGATSASDWFVIRHYDDYIKQDLVVHGVSKESNPDGTSGYRLEGFIGSESITFSVDSSKYEYFSQPKARGEVVQIYRNPKAMSVTFQQKSLNVIFADEWRDLEPLVISARSTMWIAIALFSVAAVLWIIARFALPPIHSRGGGMGITG